jgi:putative phosphoribosyl transferase
MIFKNIRNKFQLKLKNRVCAGNILGEALKDVTKKDEKRKNCIVLGIPRGGVIIADIIGRKFSCEFGIITPRKLCAPHNKELAIGAVIGDGVTFLNEFIVKELEISHDYIEKEKLRELKEIRRRTSLNCSGNRIFADSSNITFDNKTVILADDGAATGATIIAAARWIRSTKNPRHLLIAVPIVPNDTLNRLKNEDVDHIEVITSPKFNFRSIEQYYHNFEQITDNKVIGTIDRNRR